MNCIKIKQLTFSSFLLSINLLIIFITNSNTLLFIFTPISIILMINNCQLRYTINYTVSLILLSILYDPLFCLIYIIPYLCIGFSIGVFKKINITKTKVILISFMINLCAHLLLIIIFNINLYFLIFILLYCLSQVIIIYFIYDEHFKNLSKIIKK